MSGDHNMHQKPRSFVERYEKVRELVKDPTLRVTDIAMQTGYDKGHVSRLRKESLRQALETEQKTAVSPGKGTGFNYARAIGITVLRQALETEQEPVAWISDSPTKGNGKQLHWTKAEAWRWSSNITPLYTAPPKKEWVGLMDEEFMAIAQKYSLATRVGLEYFKDELEAKLKEKNA